MYSVLPRERSKLYHEVFIYRNSSAKKCCLNYIVGICIIPHMHEHE